MKKVVIDQQRCKGCGLCVEFCPKKALVISEQLNKAGLYPAEFFDEEACTSCGICAMMCPEACISVYRESKKSAVGSRQ